MEKTIAKNTAARGNVVNLCTPASVYVYFARFVPSAAAAPKSRRPLYTGWLYLYLPEQGAWYEYEVTVPQGPGATDVRNHLKNVHDENGKASSFVELAPKKNTFEVRVAFSKKQWASGYIDKVRKDKALRESRMLLIKFDTRPDALKKPFNDRERVHGIQHIEKLNMGLTVDSISQIKSEADGKGTVVIATISVFGIDLALNDGDDAVLTPLRVYDFSKLEEADDPTGGKLYNEPLNPSENKDHVTFKISVEDHDVDDVKIEIVRGSLKKSVDKISLGSSKQKGSTMHKVGTHEWTWDGYAKGILDTTTLTDPTLALELSATLDGVTVKKVMTFENRAREVDWVDVKIDSGAKKIDVTLRVHIVDDGEEIGPLPPEATDKWTASKALTPALSSQALTLYQARVRQFADLQALVLAGIKLYWSRSVTIKSKIVGTPAPVNVKYYVTATAVGSTQKAMKKIGVKYVTNVKSERSSNPGSVRGLPSFVGNAIASTPWLNARIMYQVGWIKFDSGWYYVEPARPSVGGLKYSGTGWVVGLYTADEDFKLTAAHEIGHEILGAYGGDWYSYTHRGSTNVFQVQNHGNSNPTSGEIDLMKYYYGYDSSRSVASEADVKSFLWLARVKFVSKALSEDPECVRPSK